MFNKANPSSSNPSVTSTVEYRRSKRLASLNFDNIGPPKINALSPSSLPSLSPKSFVNTNPEGLKFEFPCVVSKIINMNDYQKIEFMSRNIPEFNGNSDDIHKFLSCVDRAHDSCTTNEQKGLLVDIILYKLGSKVYNMIASVKPNSWDEIRSHLSKFYHVTDTFDDIERKISSLKFEPLCETIQDYFLRTENLTSRYQKLMLTHLGDDKKAKTIAEKRIIPRFIIGLPESIRNYVRMYQSESLMKCMEAAMEQLNFVKNLYEDENHTKMFNTNHTHPEPIIPQVQNMQVSYCRYCKRNGHVIQECRTKQRNDSRTQMYQNNSFPRHSNNVSSYQNFSPNSFKTQTQMYQSNAFPRHSNNVNQYQNFNPNNSNTHNFFNTQKQYSPPQFHNRNKSSFPMRFPQDTGNPNNPTINPQHSHSVSWSNPAAVSTPIKSRNTRFQPQNPTISNIDNFSNAFQGLSISNNPPNPPNPQNSHTAQIHYYDSEQTSSENSSGLNNAQERSDA